MPIRHAASFFLPLFAIACLVVCYLTGHAMRPGLINADAMYLPTLAEDLLRHGGRLSDWYLTPAPYLFPDGPMFLPAYLLGSDAYRQLIIFGAIQCAAVWGAAYVLGRALRVDAALPCAAFSLVLLAWLALSGLDPFVLLLSAGFHFGSFIVGVLVVAGWLRFEENGARRTLWAVCALAVVTALCDSLLLVQIALPLACAGTLRALLEPDYLAGRRRRMLLPWVPALAALVGHLGYRVLVTNRMRYNPHVDLQHVGANLRDVGAIVRGLWEAMPLAVLGWFAFLAFALACTLRLMQRRDPFGLPRRLAWLLVFWLISLAGMLTVELLVYNLPVAARYFVVAACWPVLLAPLMAAHLLRGRAPAPILLATVICAIGIGAATARQWQAHPIETSHYPAEVACLDQALAGTDLHDGIAQYWDAKTFQHFSRRNIVLAQYIYNLEELRWINTGRIFKPAYDFALVGPRGDKPHYIPEDQLLAINGEPAARVSCGAYTVLLYGRGKMKVH